MNRVATKLCNKQISDNLRKAYNSIFNSTNLLVKNHSPHLNLNHLKIDSHHNDNQIIDRLNQLCCFIQNPHYSHIFLRK